MSKRNRRIAIIGGGPGGICQAIKLRVAGYDDLTIYELSDGIGGTWHRNRYPGLECDIVSDLYTFTFAPNPDWSNSYPPQTEILDYMRKVARDHDIDRHAPRCGPGSRGNGLTDDFNLGRCDDVGYREPIAVLHAETGGHV